MDIKIIQAGCIDKFINTNYIIIAIAHMEKHFMMRDIVKVFKALSNETRLRILNILLVRECCVCEVMQALEISQARASRNLGVLYDAGFLKLRHDGLWSLYSIDKESAKRYCTDLTEAVRKALEGNETALIDRQRLESVERVGPSRVAKAR